MGDKYVLHFMNVRMGILENCTIYHGGNSIWWKLDGAVINLGNENTMQL